MRLRMPTIQHLESACGSCSLTYEGRDSAPQQAGGGSMYFLRISQPDADVEVRATVQLATFSDVDKQAKSEGLDYMAMSAMDARYFHQKFSDDHGSSWWVVVCRVSQNDKTANIDQAAAKFCHIFLDMISSYRFNNPDYPACGEGHYLDRIDFSPWDIDKKHYREFSSREIFQ